MLFREGADIQITEPRSKAKYKGTLKNIYNEVNILTEFKRGTESWNDQCYMISKVVPSVLLSVVTGRNGREVYILNLTILGYENLPMNKKTSF